MEKSNKQYDETILKARTEFSEKFDKYGNSLKNYTQTYFILEKIYTKLNRVKTIQEKGKMLVDEPIDRTLLEIINYCIYGIYRISLLENKSEITDVKESILNGYDAAVITIKEVFKKKNTDYDEIWRKLSLGFMITESHTKKERGTEMYSLYKFKNPSLLQKELKEIFIDIANYNIFCRIKIDEGADPLF